MEELYKEYFQKSKTFLYPLLGFSRVYQPMVKEVFLSWDGYTKLEDKHLICVFKKNDSEKWSNFEINNLMTHPLLIESIAINDNKVIYIFDFSVPGYVEDFDLFIKGKYSKLSINAKKHIAKYFGINTPEWVYIESFIHPAKYYKIYSKLLGIDVDHLKDGELCSFFDSDKENCPYKISLIKECNY